MVEVKEVEKKVEKVVPVKVAAAPKKVVVEKVEAVVV